MEHRQNDIPTDDDHPMSTADPNFIFGGGALPKDYWSDWMCELARSNAQRIQSVDETFMDFLTLEATQYIFTVCVRLRLPNDVRYKAALLFEKFMTTQTRTLYEFIAASDRSTRKKEQEWEKIEANLSRQVTLRIASAIQIASKEQSYHTSLSTIQICSCLRTLGFAYTRRAVLQSELRMLKVLNYILPGTPLIYPESLLKCIGTHAQSAALTDMGSLNQDACWEHVLLFLDIVFMHNQRFYDFLLSTVMAQQSSAVRTLSKLDRCRVMADWMLLGSGLVAAAVSCVHGSACADKTIRLLSQLCGTPKQDITDTSVALMEVTMILKRESAQAQLI